MPSRASEGHASGSGSRSASETALTRLAQNLASIGLLFILVHALCEWHAEIDRGGSIDRLGQRACDLGRDAVIGIVVVGGGGSGDCGQLHQRRRRSHNLHEHLIKDVKKEERKQPFSKTEVRRDSFRPRRRRGGGGGGGG